MLTVGVLFACGDDADETVGDAEIATTTTTTTATDTTVTSTTTSTPTSSTTTSTSTTLGTVVTLPGDTPEEAVFSSPTGNISCNVHVVNGASCLIGDKEWASPPVPADCDLDWGNYVHLGDDAGFVCAGDTPIYREPAELPYGSAVQRGRYTCGVEATGVTCRNDDTGAGFRLSRGRYELFGEQ